MRAQKLHNDDKAYLKDHVGVEKKLKEILHDEDTAASIAAAAGKSIEPKVYSAELVWDMVKTYSCAIYRRQCEEDMPAVTYLNQMHSQGKLHVRAFILF